MLGRKGARVASSQLSSYRSLARRQALRRLHVESLERRQLLAELAEVTMEVTNLAGDTVTTLATGQEYYLKAYVQDISGAEALGVTAAFFDVAVSNNDLLTIEDQTGAEAGILFSSQFPLGHSGTNLVETSSSEFDEVGAATVSQHGGARTPFFQVKFTADAEGQLVFSANQADLSGNFFSLVDAGVIANADVVFGDVTVEVVDPIALADDAVTRIEDQAQATIDVLANDIDGAARWTIQTISDISLGATVEISTDGKAILYTPASNAVGAETFVYTTVDDNGVTGQATVTVTLEPQNDAPVNLVPGSQTFSASSRTVVFDGLNTISTHDLDANGQNLRVTLFVNRGIISLNSTAGLDFLNGSANNTRYLLFDGTEAEVNAAIEGLTYTANVGASSDVLTLDVHDLGHTGAGGAQIDRDTINLTAAGSSANDPPVNTVPLARFFTNSDRTITFGPLSRVRTSDPDAGNLPVRVTLFVNRGVINLSQTDGLTFLNGANGTRYLLFDGTIDDVNEAMFNMTYTANAGATSDVLTLDVHDLGHTGTGGAKVDRDAVQLALIGTLPNTAPINVVPGPQTFTPSDRTVTFGLLNPVSTFDADAGGDDLRVTLFVNRGRISLSTTQGLTFRNGSANNTRYLLFDGSQDDIRDALFGMTYTANAGTTSDVFTIDVHDLGNNGSGGHKVDRDSFTLTQVGTFAAGGSGEAGSANTQVRTSASARTSSSADAALAAQASSTASQDSATRLAELLASSNSGRARAAINADAAFASQR